MSEVIHHYNYAYFSVCVYCDTLTTRGHIMATGTTVNVR